MTYTLTWYHGGGAEPVTAALRDVTPDALLDAAADCDMPHEWFTDAFLYRTLYGITYQLLVGADAEVDMPDGMLVVVVVVVPRAVL
jgi:hypothetical protein